MNGRSIVCALLLTGLVAGCASVRVEMPEESVRHHELSTRRMLAEGVSIVGDGCIGSTALAGSVVYRDESVDYAGAALARFGKFLATQGIQVHQQTLPLLCGQLGAGDSTLRVAEDADSDDQAMAPPIIVAEQLRGNPRLALAYTDLLGAAAKVGPTAGAQPATGIEVSLDLSEDTVVTLRQALGSPLIFIASVRGSQVSGPRKWLTAIATGVASVAISGGAFVQISSIQSVTIHSLVLIDLDRRKAMWKTEIVAPKIDPLDASYRKQHMVFWEGLMARPFLRTPLAGVTIATADAKPLAQATESIGSAKMAAPPTVEMAAAKRQSAPPSGAAGQVSRRTAPAKAPATSR